MSEERRGERLGRPRRRPARIDLGEEKTKFTGASGQGRAGQGGSWATGKGAGLTARLEGETSGRPAGSGGRSRPCGEGSGERQRRSSIPGD